MSHSLPGGRVRWAGGREAFFPSIVREKQKVQFTVLQNKSSRENLHISDVTRLMNSALKLLTTSFHNSVSSFHACSFSNLIIGLKHGVGTPPHKGGKLFSNRKCRLRATVKWVELKLSYTEKRRGKCYLFPSSFAHWYNQNPNYLIDVCGHWSSFPFLVSYSSSSHLWSQYSLRSVFSPHSFPCPTLGSFPGLPPTVGTCRCSNPLICLSALGLWHLGSMH